MHTQSFPSEEISSSSMKLVGGRRADIACLLPVEGEEEGARLRGSGMKGQGESGEGGILHNLPNSPNMQICPKEKQAHHLFAILLV